MAFCGKSPSGFEVAMVVVEEGRFSRAFRFAVFVIVIATLVKRSTLF